MHLPVATPIVGSSYFSGGRLGIKVPLHRRFFTITKTILAVDVEVDRYGGDVFSRQSMVVRASRVQRYLTAVVSRSRYGLHPIKTSGK